MTLELIVCETCRHRSGWRDSGACLDGLAMGAAVARGVKGIATSDAALDGLRLTTTACLLTCGRAGTIRFRQRTRPGRPTGAVRPDGGLQEALVAYLRARLGDPNPLEPPSLE